MCRVKNVNVQYRMAEILLVGMMLMSMSSSVSSIFPFILKSVNPDLDIMKFWDMEAEELDTVSYKEAEPNTGSYTEPDGSTGQDCEGSWSEWGPCNVPCGSGQKTRMWTTTVNPVGEYATPCPSPTLETEVCNTQECSGNGNVSDADVVSDAADAAKAAADAAKAAAAAAVGW